MIDVDDAALLAFPLSDTTDPLYDRIRQIAHAIPPLRRRVASEISAVSNADADFDFVAFRDDLVDLANLTDNLVAAIAAYKASPAYQADAQAAGMLDNYFAFAREWASQVLAYIPQGVHNAVDWTTGQVVDLTKQVTDALARILANTTKSAFSGLFPLIAGGSLLILGAIALAKKAEGTRTYRHYVA